MGRIDKPEYKKKESIYPVYIAKDFFQMERELEKYAIDKKLLKPGNKKGERELVHFVPVQGIQSWYIEKGALSENKNWCIKDIALFRELQDKLYQYYSWCRRREYAIKHQTEEYGQLAEQMQVIDDIPF